MAADAPGMAPAALAQNPLAHADRVGIDDLIGAVAVGVHHALGQGERVVVGGRLAQIQPHEGDHGRTIRQHLNILGMKPNRLCKKRRSPGN